MEEKVKEGIYVYNASTSHESSNNLETNCENNMKNIIQLALEEVKKFRLIGYDGNILNDKSVGVR